MVDEITISDLLPEEEILDEEFYDSNEGFSEYVKEAEEGTWGDLAEMLIGWGQPGHGLAGDISRDYYNQVLDIASFFPYIMPSVQATGGWSGLPTAGEISETIQDLKYDTESGNEPYWDRIYPDYEYENLENWLETIDDLPAHQMTWKEKEYVKNPENADEIISDWREQNNFGANLNWPDYLAYEGVPSGKEFLNYFMTESTIPEDNPYYDLADDIRKAANVAPYAISLVGNKIPLAGKYIKKGKDAASSALPSLVNRLPEPMQKVAKHLFPKWSGQGTIFPKKINAGKWYNPKNYQYYPSTVGNMALAGTIAGGKELIGSANAAEIMSNPQYDPVFGSSDPVIFDSYMQDKLTNFEPRPTAPGPRPNYQGL